MEVRDTVCDFDKLYEGMLKCRRGVMWKDSVSRFVNNPFPNLLKLRTSLLNGTYSISDYYCFTIHEPKTRDIVSTRFKDRTFQRSLCDNYLYDAITRTFIYDNGACQTGRGTDFARNRLKVQFIKYSREHGPDGYVLRCDIKSYFGSTPHEVAKQVMAKRVKDEWALQHVYALIDSYDTGDQIGLGLGSQVTQLIQLAVLCDLDHHIKEKLRVKYYERYMDDLILIHKSKEFLRKCLEVISSELAKLGLKLSMKKTQICPISQGIIFLGFKYKITSTGKVLMLVSKENVNKRKRKARKYVELVNQGKMTREKADQTQESWRAHAKKGDSKLLVKRMDKYYLNLWKEAA